MPTACAMNFFTHNTGYSLFPKTTFDDRKAYPVDAYAPENELFYDRYKILGWDIVMPPFKKENSSLPKIRYVGDRGCWIVSNIFPTLPPLETTTGTDAEGLPLVDYLHSFRILYNPIVSLRFCTLYDPILWHSGTYASHDKVHAFVEYITRDASTKESLQINMKNFLEYNFNGEVVPLTESEIEEDFEHSRDLEKFGWQTRPPVDENDSGDDAEDDLMMILGSE
ncbi:hypothetical protein BDN72DRAFT_902510 [Pluteus cervinus]|uniref:Uncharacterized protein n=1 Tax=Pluteus cervinus TaxID=181527 RepID=A0ACD3ADB8_9AGAR|nr:hypothetical protein BDN72DRAFT_902510 [Pluteus cervinus]